MLKRKTTIPIYDGTLIDKKARRNSNRKNSNHLTSESYVDAEVVLVESNPNQSTAVENISPITNPNSDKNMINRLGFNYDVETYDMWPNKNTDESII